MSAHVEHRSATSVLVIGSGAAGLRAAIELAENGTQVLVVGKRRRDDAHTVLAAGGINAALATTDPEDTWQQHAYDTLKEGYWLNDPRAVEILAQEAPRAIADLARWGAGFARQEDGRLQQRFFGAHRWRRTCYAGDYTGREIQLALVRRAQELPVDFQDSLYVTRLLVHDGQCFGAYAFDVSDGTRHVLLADAVILAAGGHTRAWRRSSSRRDENNGDAMRLALQAGCRLRDMELVQFHPTGMAWPEEHAGTLVTEAVRGEGGVLRNADGERYMERYDPERMELSSRDRVALANYTEIAEGRGTDRGSVLLDITGLGRDGILAKLPRMYRQLIDLAMVDISREPIDVSPTAHYSMGGVLVDAETHSTDVSGLWAVGECAAGVHGANRLGGNSLAETVVFGRLVGRAAADFSRAMEVQPRDHSAIRGAAEEVDAILAKRNPGQPVRALQRSVRDAMWEHGGVVRSEEGLIAGLRRLDEVGEEAAETEVRPDIAGFEDLVHAFDLRAMLDSSRATLECARERRETRGAHNRADFPEQDDAGRVSLLYDAAGSVERAPLGDVPGHISAVADSDEVPMAGRLLE